MSVFKESKTKKNCAFEKNSTKKLSEREELREKIKEKKKSLNKVKKEIDKKYAESFKLEREIDALQAKEELIPFRGLEIPVGSIIFKKCNEDGWHADLARYYTLTKIEKLPNGKEWLYFEGITIHRADERIIVDGMKPFGVSSTMKFLKSIDYKKSDKIMTVEDGRKHFGKFLEDLKDESGLDDSLGFLQLLLEKEKE